VFFVDNKPLNGHYLDGLKLLKGVNRKKLQKAEAPTTVESLNAIDIKRVENPFAKDDEDSDASGHLPDQKFHNAKSVSRSKMVHNTKEKKR